jgi:hypothetical protein
LSPARLVHLSDQATPLVVDLTEKIFRLEDAGAVVFEPLVYKVLSVGQRLALKILFELAFSLN